MCHTTVIFKLAKYTQLQPLIASSSLVKETYGCGFSLQVMEERKIAWYLGCLQV